MYEKNEMYSHQEEVGSDRKPKDAI